MTTTTTTTRRAVAVLRSEVADYVAQLRREGATVHSVAAIGADADRYQRVAFTPAEPVTAETITTREVEAAADALFAAEVHWYKVISVARGFIESVDQYERAENWNGNTPEFAAWLRKSLEDRGVDIERERAIVMSGAVEHIDDELLDDPRGHYVDERDEYDDDGERYFEQLDRMTPLAEQLYDDERRTLEE